MNMNYTELLKNMKTDSKFQFECGLIVDELHQCLKPLADDIVHHMDQSAMHKWIINLGVERDIVLLMSEKIVPMIIDEIYLNDIVFSSKGFYCTDDSELSDDSDCCIHHESFIESIIKTSVARIMFFETIIPTTGYTLEDFGMSSSAESNFVTSADTLEIFESSVEAFKETIKLLSMSKYNQKYIDINWCEEILNIE